MLDNRQLVHPVHKGMTFLNDALKFTAYAGYQLISCKQVRRIHRHLFGMQKVRLNPVFLELGPVNESTIF